MNILTGIVGAFGTVGIILGALFAARATKSAAVATAQATQAAAHAAAEPAARQASLAILEASVRRVDEENKQIRTELVGVRALVRAYSWTVDRLIRRMQTSGIEPATDDIHELVREHIRTGA
ncbi:hypothetical protein [Streptomyces sp. NBC_00306]|uniref:hypothetical protein n=1 Tax=Streptomyces sp. NBC_00306 TaxID=2975708 RepID=UPI002E2B560F|nr:hypothetical protein [Streptomyces sp. NBC_00306]